MSSGRIGFKGGWPLKKKKETAVERANKIRHKFLLKKLKSRTPLSSIEIKDLDRFEKGLASYSERETARAAMRKKRVAANALTRQPFAAHPRVMGLPFRPFGSQ